MAAWQLLNYHAALARTSSKPGDQLIEGLGLLDVMMADNLEYIVSREALSWRSAGLCSQQQPAAWKGIVQLDPNLLIWWPAGAQLHEIFGLCYAVIGTVVDVSDDNDIGQMEAKTLKARLIAVPGLG